jgi:peptide-methionine (S)-S-oxide reductase
MATETATLAGGCFWCTEAVYNRLRGVQSVMPGYTGGEIANPSYEAVCSGQTGHAEAAQVVFDTDVIDYETILHVFFATHDPTQLNGQGADIGTQYRSGVFYHDAKQKETAERVIRELGSDGHYSEPIVTEVTALDVFYPAEDYHKAYYERNRDRNPYCRVVIDPKVQKLLSSYGELTKTPGAV